MAEENPASRRIYAMVVAADEFCPNIEARFGWSGLVRYDPLANGETERLTEAKADWFRQMKGVGRTIACEAMADEYGPGNERHLFDLAD